MENRHSSTKYLHFQFHLVWHHFVDFYSWISKKILDFASWRDNRNLIKTLLSLRGRNPRGVGIYIWEKGSCNSTIILEFNITSMSLSATNSLSYDFILKLLTVHLKLSKSSYCILTEKQTFFNYGRCTCHIFQQYRWVVHLFMNIGICWLHKFCILIFLLTYSYFQNFYRILLCKVDSDFSSQIQK